jgi:hypothetical protein
MLFLPCAHILESPMNKKTKSYNELTFIQTYLGRFDYLKLNGSVGFPSHPRDRALLQDFYQSSYWKKIREAIITRDLGNDLGFPDSPIFGTPFVHHINPITPEDVLNGSPLVIDPNNLISCAKETHQAIHYSDRSLLRDYEPRRPGDTNLW